MNIMNIEIKNLKPGTEFKNKSLLIEFYKDRMLEANATAKHLKDFENERNKNG